MTPDHQKRLAFPEFLEDEANEQAAILQITQGKAIDEAIAKEWSSIHNQVVQISGVIGVSFPAPWGPSRHIEVEVDSQLEPYELATIRSAIGNICPALMQYIIIPEPTRTLNTNPANAVEERNVLPMNEERVA